MRSGGGYAVPGFWQPEAPSQPLDAYMCTGVLTTDLFVLAVDEFAEQLAAPAVLVLGNASIHTALLMRECHAAWAAAGLTLLFLPPYSLEINKIEMR